MMDPAVVRGWVERAEAEVAQLTSEAERAQFRLAEARRRLLLLYEMLAALTDVPLDLASSGLGANPSTRQRVQDLAAQILRESGRPMHIQEIHAEFVRRQLPLPGRGNPTNIIAHLTAGDRFKRYGRGIYGLSEWGSIQVASETTK